MSLLADYNKERAGRDTIESRRGFLTYKALPTDEEPKEYRIFDLYVVPKYRRVGEAAKMADQVASIAKQNGCKILTGSVDTTANGSTESTKVLLAYGFKILRAEGHMIYFLKECE